MRRQLSSFLLPAVVAGFIPFLLVARFEPFSIDFAPSRPYLQFPLGAILFALGFFLLIITVRMFMRIGKGTLAPWAPTQRLVVQGVYRYTRNPMISGVACMLLGEATFMGSRPIFAWFVLFVLINTIYFKLSEEPGLVKRFGDEYVRYRKNVPMWIPRLRPWMAENDGDDH